MTAPEDDLTELQRIITAAAQRSTVGYLSRTAEKAGEELAQEIMRDPEWRAQIQAIIRSGVQTLEALQSPRGGHLAFEVRALRDRIGRLETLLSEALERRNGAK